MAQSLHSFLILSIILLLLSFSTANIWDNLYDGEGVPYQLPYNFKTVLTPENIPGNLYYNLSSNKVLNVLYMNVTTMFPADKGEWKNVEISQIKFNFTHGEISANSDKYGCILLQSKKYLDFYYFIEGLLELGLLMNSHEKVDNYKMVSFDTTTKVFNISNCIKKFKLFFKSDEELSHMQFHAANDQSYGFYLHNMTEGRDFNNDTFKSKGECKKVHIVKINGKSYLEKEGEDTAKDPLSRVPLGKAMLEYLIPPDITGWTPEEYKKFYERMNGFLDMTFDCQTFFHAMAQVEKADLAGALSEL